MTYIVDSVVCDYGVFEVWWDKDGQKHKDLKLICNSRSNALMIADIMEKDLRGIVASSVLEDIKAEIEQLHIIGYAELNGKREIAKRAIFEVIDNHISRKEQK